MNDRAGTLPGRRGWSAARSRRPAENATDAVASTATTTAIIGLAGVQKTLSLIHISEPTRPY